MSWLVKVFLDWVFGKIMDLVTAYIKMKQARVEIEKKNKEVREKTEKAETTEERDDAAKDVISNF